MSLLLALVLAAQESPRFEFETDSKLLVDGVPYTLTIRAVDAEGKTDVSFEGTIKVEGLNGFSQVGPFKEGQITLEGLKPGTGPVRILSTPPLPVWEPRVLPGWLTILPPMAAILLAIFTRQVLVSLLAGIWLGATFVHGYNPLEGALRTFDTYLVAALGDPDHAAIILFTVALGGMVGVIGRSGGGRALVEIIARVATTRRAGMVSTCVMGVVIFFDDYANCMLVGHTARPFTDSRKISREKLSFLIDATAAPIAGIIGLTWIGYEVGQLENTGVIAAGEGFSVFLATIPYRFYSILMLVFVFMISASGRDFGPMLRAEKRAIETGAVVRPGSQPLVDKGLTEMEIPPENRRYWWNAAGPIGAVIAIAVLCLVVLGNDNSYQVLIWAAFGGSLVALGLAAASRAVSFEQAMEAWVVGCRSMILAVLILVLAWTLGSICREYLQIGAWVMSQVEPPAALLPLIVFFASCLIAFSTGTSWGTMAIVFPIAGPMAWALAGDGDPVRFATLGAVLTGAVFGDHCSPISDTTVMSSTAAGSDHVDHVRTQAPYALVCAAVAALVGFIPVGFGIPWWVSLPVGAGILATILFTFGRRAEMKAESTA